MKWVEPAGLVKFDFLGLKTLTVLDVAVKLLRKRGVDVDLATLPLDDAASYQMLARGDVVGVFQVESQGMRRALVDMRPDRFEDIIALVALYRPGPMANIPTYCARKHGDEEPEYLHPMLEPILKETFGVIIYQEQVMQIAQVMAGYSLGEADLLRRAMGKKIRSEMEKQRAGFVAGAMKNNVPKGQADTIFELLAKFADYGFNKSHAAAYALVSYHTAYMKAHYQRRHHLLCARRPEGRRRAGGRADRRRTKGWPVHLIGRFRSARESARDQQARHREPGRGRRVRRAGFQSGTGVRRRRSDPRSVPAQP